MPRNIALQVKENIAAGHFHSVAILPTSTMIRRPQARRYHPMVAIMQDIAISLRGQSMRTPPLSAYDRALSVPEDMQ